MRSTARSAASETPAITHGVRSRTRELPDPPTVFPQREQKRAVGASDTPQEEQDAPSRGEPQWEQNFPDPGVRQVGQAVGESVMNWKEAGALPYQVNLVDL
jgi:hypothetical protein